LLVPQLAGESDEPTSDFVVVAGDAPPAHLLGDLIAHLLELRFGSFDGLAAVKQRDEQLPTAVSVDQRKDAAQARRNQVVRGPLPRLRAHPFDVSAFK